MLAITQVTKSFRRGPETITPLRDFDLTVEKGEFVSLFGPSGSGKSTLLLIAGGLLHPDKGEIQVAGQNLYGLADKARTEFRARHIGFVFQQFHLIPYLSVLDNILAPSLAWPIAEALSRAMDLIDRFGLGHRLHHVPSQLSTGERQRTALARALLPSPGLLLADEPTGNLDEDNGRRVLEQLRECARSGVAVLLVTHDPRGAEMSHRVVNLSVKAQREGVGVP